MAFKKFGNPEKIVPVEKDETEIILSHISKTGKSIEDFTDEERESLHNDIDQTITKQ